MHKLPLLLAVMGLLALLLPPTAQAATYFAGSLDGLKEVPLSMTTATGTMTMVLNDARTELSYHVEFSGLLGVETAAHFHNAQEGANGPALHVLPLGSPKDGVWIMTASDVAELMAGRIYLNVRSTVFPAGEIRGQILKQPTPAQDLSWGNIKALY